MWGKSDETIDSQHRIAWYSIQAATPTHTHTYTCTGPQIYAPSTFFRKRNNGALLHRQSALSPNASRQRRGGKRGIAKK